MELFKDRNYRYSIYDGMLTNVFATLTGGMFLTGFALHLGMNELMIGLVAAMPFVVTVFQLPTSYFIRKNGNRKKIARLGSFLARAIWFPILVTALLPASTFSNRQNIILALIFLSYSFASISYVSWLSWMSEIVPNDMRGRFFGSRNMFAGAATMVTMIVFGKLLDDLNKQEWFGLPSGFAITIVCAILFGISSLHFLTRVSEPAPIQEPIAHVPFKRLIVQPFREPNFRFFLAFALAWGFSVNFASPFFTVYLLRELGLTYGFVATLGILSAFADLIGMQFWGRVSDRVKNKAVIQFSGWVAIFLPLAWVTVRPQNFVMPIILHVVGGGFWAGINLCMNNLLLRISHAENKAFYFSVFNTTAGLGAAAGPVLAGLFLGVLDNSSMRLFDREVLPLQIVFAISTLLRLLSFQILRLVHEPEEAKPVEVIRILRGIRGMNVTSGFNFLLHPFVAVKKDKETG